MAETMTLVPVRTSRQGTSLNAGKLKQDYQDETSTVEIHVDDMVRLGLKKGDTIRMRSSGGSEAIVNCKVRKTADATPGMVFMAYGPVSSRFMEDDTAGTGMPISKHLPIEIEGPLSPDGTVLSADALPVINDSSSPGQLGSPLSAQQSAQLDTLLASGLTTVQSAWISGYFSALSGGQQAIPQVDGSVQPVGAASTLPLMSILFGSQTGNGEGLAEQLKMQAERRGFNVKVSDMADYEPASLVNEKLLFVVVSTHGEGDPPMAAEELHEFLQSDAAPRLENLKYAVFALGDSSYENFCQTGKDFDHFLNNLGATSVLKRVDADIDFEEPGEVWIGDVLSQYEVIAERAGGSVSTDGTLAEVAKEERSQYSKTNPYPASILHNINISGKSSAKENRHIEIDLGDSRLTYEPGDALGVYPKNNPVYVEELLTELAIDGDTKVIVGKESMSFAEACLLRLDITTLSRTVVEKYAAQINNPNLDSLLDELHKGEFKDYIWGRNILDLVEDYPATGFSAQNFVDVLRHMPSRLYSIASSLSAHENQVHLLVGAVRYHSHQRDREGVCSTFLAGRLQDDEKLQIYVQKNKNFRLPEDTSKPVIMVGPGTGLAPFRAFLEHRQTTAANGKNWLFFGDQHRASDFLYEDDLNTMLELGVLTRMNAAFSRDQADKIYVQTHMLEQAAELYAWLEEGAYFYVCGDAERMAVDVHKALLKIIAGEGGKSDAEAEVYLKAMQSAKRYQRDVY